MPSLDFECNKCKTRFDDLVKFDPTGKYPTVQCPKCGSKKKTNLVSAPQFNFTNAEGTDRWNSESSGHDYRFKSNVPKVQAERQMAEALSHMGPTPYQDTSTEDIELDVGIHDAQSRKGLS